VCVKRFRRLLELGFVHPTGGNTQTQYIIFLTSSCYCTIKVLEKCIHIIPIGYIYIHTHFRYSTAEPAKAQRDDGERIGMDGRE
jgi:hypothetical protein